MKLQLRRHFPITRKHETVITKNWVLVQLHCYFAIDWMRWMGLYTVGSTALNFITL